MSMNRWGRGALLAIMLVLVACAPAKATGPPEVTELVPIEFQPPMAGSYTLVDYHLEITSPDGTRREVFDFDAELVNDARLSLDPSNDYSGNISAAFGKASTWVRLQIFDNVSGSPILDEPFWLFDNDGGIAAYTISECRSTCPNGLGLFVRRPSHTGWQMLLSRYEFTSWQDGKLIGVDSRSRIEFAIE